MTNYTKPSGNTTNKIWSNTAPVENVQQPDDAYINLGWTQVKPPSEYFNWWMKKVDTLLAYTNQKGIPEWDSSTEYQANSSFVQLDNKIWLAIKTNTNSKPSTSNGNWKDYLQGFATQVYADNAVSTLKKSLHKVATSGLASDLQGYLPWGQLSDVPQWIRETHTDNGQLYMRSPDGTQYRLGNGRLDFFNGDKLIFSVDPSGVIDNGTIAASQVTAKANKNISSLDNPTTQQLLSVLGSSSTKPTEYFDIAGAAENAKNAAIAATTVRDASRRVGFINGNVLNPYVEHWKDSVSTIVPLARSAWVSEINSTLTETKNNLGTISSQNSNYVNITGGNITASNFVSTRNSDTYRIVTGSSSDSCGAFWRMDSTNLYLMITNEGDPYGTWKDANSGGMPLYIKYREKTLGFNNNVEFKGGLELYNGGGTPFLDFHYGGDTGDYTSRIIEKTKGELTATGSMAFGNARKTLDNLGFDVNKQTKGHQQIGTDGIIIQWGPWTSPARGAGQWTGFDKTFPNACMGVVVGVLNAASQMAGAKDHTNGGFIATTGNEDPQARNGWYIAIGW